MKKFAALPALLVLLSSTVHAQSYLQNYYFVGVGGTSAGWEGYSPPSSPEAYWQTQPDGSFEHVVFSASPYVSILSEAFSRTQGGRPLSIGVMKYDVLVSGPADSLIPVASVGYFRITETGILFENQGAFKNYASIIFHISTNVGTSYTLSQCSDGCDTVGENVNSFSQRISQSEYRGQFFGLNWVRTDASGSGVLAVSLTAYARAYLEYSTDGPSTAGISTFIDPYFSIDASYLTAHPETQLTLPNGVANAIPVPEPSALTLTLGGCCWLGVILLRTDRRQRALSEMIGRR